MSVQADLAPIPLGEFNERVRGELIPLNRQFSYFIAGLLLSEEDVRDYLEEPAAALPPEIVNRLPHVTVLLVPFLSRVNGKAARDGDLAAGLVCFDKPAETKMVWAASAAFHDEAVLAFAIKNLDVADYHYHFYHHLATSMASLLKPEELREYYGVLREELEHHANGEVDEESWKLKQALLRKQTSVRRETKPFLDYAQESFIDTLTLYLHGICCDIDVETGPRQLPSRFLRRRLMLLRNLFPPPKGYAVFPEDLDTDQQGG
jgi:hypothetical protein